MEYNSTYGRQPETPPYGSKHRTGDELGFVCQVVQQYISILSPEKLPLFVASISQILNDALKRPHPSSATSAIPNGEKRFAARQRQFGVGEEVIDASSPHEWVPESAESPKDNIAFRTIPCRNWIKYKGNCRLGGKCRFIHDPAFISFDEEEDEFPRSPAPHCWSYIQGTCYKGSQCKYYHPPSAHMRIYQRYTPCREWDRCIRSACPFRHAPVVADNLSDPTLNSPQGFGEQPLVYRNEFQNAKFETPGCLARVGNGMDHVHHPYHHSLASLDTIHEEFGSIPSFPNSLASSRRRSVGPSQFVGFEKMEKPGLESSYMRPRGKSFDVAFMLPTKRDSY